jgi:hypothetical protein
VFGGDPEAAGRLQEESGVGLPGQTQPSGLPSVHQCVEETADSRLFEEFGRVPGGGGGGQRDPGGPQGTQQADRARVGVDAPATQPLGEQPLLVGGDGADLGIGGPQSPGFEKGRGAVEARLAVDVAQIVLARVEGALAAWAQKSVEGRLPRGGVQSRGVRDDAVGVEDHGPRPPQRGGYADRAAPLRVHRASATSAVRSRSRLV